MAEPGHVWKGWAVVEDGYLRYTEALERHLHEEATLYSGTPPGKEQLEHCVATAWNALARLELLLADAEWDEEQEGA